jgi:GntR family transcriptional regulator
MATTRAESVAHELERRILMGEYAQGSQLPSESELASSVGVSRTTLREAVGRLVARGLLRREQGRGTYVRGRSRIQISMLLEANLSISDMIREMGMTPKTTEVTTAVEVPPEEVAVALGRPGLQHVLCVRRVRAADGEPAVYSTDYLPIEPGLPLESDSYRGSVYELLGDFYGLPVTSGHALLRAGLAGRDLAPKLHLAPGDLTLVLSQVHSLSDGRMVMFSLVHLRNDMFSVYVRRGTPEGAGARIAGAAPASHAQPSGPREGPEHGGGE